jgi:hypothetical protein
LPSQITASRKRGSACMARSARSICCPAIPGWTAFLLVRMAGIATGASSLATVGAAAGMSCGGRGAPVMQARGRRGASASSTTKMSPGRGDQILLARAMRSSSPSMSRWGRGEAPGRRRCTAAAWSPQGWPSVGGVAKIRPLAEVVLRRPEEGRTRLRRQRRRAG